MATKKATAAKLDKADKGEKVEKADKATKAAAAVKIAKAAPKVPAVKKPAKVAKVTKVTTIAKGAKAKASEAAPPVRARNDNSALVIVESPAKAKTIKKYLGAGYVVKASVGHVKDLPKKKMGVDVEHDFQPEYVVIESKKKVLAEIKAAAALADRVLLAPDPDREGEAIAWHIAEEIREVNPNIQRVLFNEITKKAVTEAIAAADRARREEVRLAAGAPHPRPPGRLRDLPVLWKKVRRGLSAGRVQSVAVRLVVEREGEIKAFVPEEYWTVEADRRGAEPAAVHGQGDQARRREAARWSTRARRARWSMS